MVHGIFHQAGRLAAASLLALALGCGGEAQQADPETPPEVPAPHPELNQPTASPQGMGDPGKDGTKPADNAEIPGPAEQTPLTLPKPE